MANQFEVLYVVLGAILSHLPFLLTLANRRMAHHWVRFQVNRKLRKKLFQTAQETNEKPLSIRAFEENALKGVRNISGYRALPKKIKERYLTITKALFLFTGSYGGAMCNSQGCLRVFADHGRLIEEKNMKAWDLLQTVLEEEEMWIMRNILLSKWKIVGRRKWLLEISTGIDRREVLEKPSQEELAEAIQKLNESEERNKKQPVGRARWID